MIKIVIQYYDLIQTLWNIDKFSYEEEEVLLLS
jgi:hypothetical protein